MMANPLRLTMHRILDGPHNGDHVFINRATGGRHYANSTLDSLKHDFNVCFKYMDPDSTKTVDEDILDAQKLMDAHNAYLDQLDEQARLEAEYQEFLEKELLADLEEHDYLMGQATLDSPWPSPPNKRQRAESPGSKANPILLD